MKLLLLLDRIGEFPMEVPKAFGGFHLLFIFLSVAFGVLLCVTHKKGDDRRVRRVVFFVSLFVFLLEIFKGIVYHFSLKNGTLVLDFQWFIFPFQFCSVPMYVGMLVGIFRRGRVHDCLMAFLATFSIFAGLCVLVYPGDVFTHRMFINIQSMVCHGVMLSLGIFLYGTGYVRTNRKILLRALPVFLCALAIAVALNEVVYRSGLLEAWDVFNMFFVSPHYESTLVLYSSVHEALPFPLALFIYAAVFTLAAYFMLLLAAAIKRFAYFLRDRRARRSQV